MTENEEVWTQQLYLIQLSLGLDNITLHSQCLMQWQHKLNNLTQLISKFTTGHKSELPASQLLFLSYHFLILYFQPLKGTMFYQYTLNEFMAIQCLENPTVYCFETSILAALQTGHGILMQLPKNQAVYILMPPTCKVTVITQTTSKLHNIVDLVIISLHGC